MNKQFLSKFSFAVLVMGSVLLTTEPALARGGGGHWGGHWGGHFHGGSRFGVYLGPGFAPWGYGWGWGYPYYGYGPGYYYPPTIAVPASPPVYIERSAPISYWYYCNNPAGYYPTVKTCPEGWRAVAPQAAKP